MPQNDDTLNIRPEDIEIVDKSEYSIDINDYYSKAPDIAKSFIKGAKAGLKKIEKALYSTPAFIETIRAAIPEETLQAVLSKEQKEKLASGALKLMTKKDGSLMANLTDPKTKKIVSTVNLKSVKLTPDLNRAMTNYATQMQMAQIAEEIQYVQLAVEEVRQGQENDRLAMAYSCQQKLIQAMAINDKKIRTMALLNLTSDAENSRNLLMLSQSANIGFINDEPEDFLRKLISGSRQEKINQCMNEIRESLCVVNMVSFAEVVAYQEMGELEAAKISLQYYGNYIQKTYLESNGLVERLDMLDPSPKQYWSNALPDISKKIHALPCFGENKLMEEL